MHYRQDLDACHLYSPQPQEVSDKLLFVAALIGYATYCLADVKLSTSTFMAGGAACAAFEDNL